VRSIRYAEVNGQPGALYLDPDGHPVAVVSLDIADDLVQTVHTITNPTNSATSPCQSILTEGRTRTTPLAPGVGALRDGGRLRGRSRRVMLA
jgi:hypothetical protein